MKKLIFLIELVFVSATVFGMVNENQKSANIGIHKLTKEEATEQLWSELREGKKNVEKIKELIDFGADFNDFWSWDGGNNGKTPFIWAIEEGYPEIVEYMIQHGADVNKPAQYADRDLPIMLATIGNGNVDLVKLFLKYGANTSLTNIKGKTLIMYAAEYRNIDILKILLGKNDCDVIISQILTMKNEKVLNSEMKNRLLINAIDSNQKTALMFALQNFGRDDNGVTAKFLIGKGANVNAKDKYGNTPLIFALLSDPNYETIEYLLKEGADSKAKNKFGSTPLSIAESRLLDRKPWENEEQAATRKKKMEKIIRLLEEYKAE